MKRPTLGKSCKYQPEMVCFYTSTCKFPSAIECLKQNLFLAQRELEVAKSKQNVRNTKQSLKWRDQSFYYKKRCRMMEDFIKAQGLVLPTYTHQDKEVTLNVDSVGKGTTQPRFQDGMPSPLPSNSNVEGQSNLQ